MGWFEKVINLKVVANAYIGIFSTSDEKPVENEQGEQVIQNVSN